MKYRVYAIYSVAKFIGTVEANTPEEAIAHDGIQDYEGQAAGLCHQCVQFLGDDPLAGKLLAEEADESDPLEIIEL